MYGNKKDLAYDTLCMGTKKTWPMICMGTKKTWPMICMGTKKTWPMICMGTKKTWPMTPYVWEQKRLGLYTLSRPGSSLLLPTFVKSRIFTSYSVYQIFVGFQCSGMFYGTLCWVLGKGYHRCILYI